MVVFTCDDLSDFRKQGGCGYWRAAANRIKRADYLVCIKNKNGINSRWKGDENKHHQAFLVAKINKNAYFESGKRKVVTFDEYALLDDEDAGIIRWKGRSAIKYYYSRESLKNHTEGVSTQSGIFSPESLNWQSFSELKDSTSAEKAELSLGVKEAKKALCNYYSVSEDKMSVAITINE